MRGIKVGYNETQKMLEGELDPLTRRSIRDFKEEHISKKDLNTILVAGSYAPNGMGMQNWKFTAIQNAHLKDNGNSMPESALAIGNMMLAAHSLGIGSCWLNQLPGLTHMPLIHELLTDLDIPENHIVYGSVVMGYAAEECRTAAPRKNVIHIID